MDITLIVISVAVGLDLLAGYIGWELANYYTTKRKEREDGE